MSMDNTFEFSFSKSLALLCYNFHSFLSGFSLKRRLNKSLALGVILFLSFPLSSCKTSPYVVLKGQNYKVEIADDYKSREKGLMHRESLPKDSGMLFVFDDQRPRSFWMQNTLIPLDILYFDKNLKLVSVQKNVPPCTLPDQATAAIKGIPYTRCPSYPSKGPAQYVLELNAGTSDEIGLKPRDTLQLFLKK